MFQSPDKKHVHFTRNEGSYNYLNPKEKSAQYYFRLPHLTNEQIKEMDIRLSFLVDLEKDYDFCPDSYTPLECLHEIRSIYEGYWIHSGKGEVNKLIDYLETIEEKQEILRHQYKLQYAIAKRDYWDDEISRLEKEGDLLENSKS